MKKDQIVKTEDLEDFTFSIKIRSVPHTGNPDYPRHVHAAELLMSIFQTAHGTTCLSRMKNLANIENRNNEFTAEQVEGFKTMDDYYKGRQKLLMGLIDSKGIEFMYSEQAK